MEEYRNNACNLSSVKKDIHLMSLCCELKVGTFHNGVNRACFLAKATVDTFCHVNIISAKKFKIFKIKMV